MRITLVVAFYFICSILTVFLNKHVFTGVYIDAPLFLTWLQLLVAIGCCYIVSLYSDQWTFLSPFEYKINTALKVMPLSICFLGMIVFNNLCLKYVEVTFYQIARSLTILFQIPITYWYLGISTSYRVMGACGIVVVGYILGIEGEVNFSFIGIFYGVLSSVFVALNSVYIKKTLKIDNISGNEFKLMIYNNINGAILFPFLIFVYGETSEIYQQKFIAFAPLFIFLMLGILGTLTNLSTVLQIKYTSPLTHNVSGTCKACVQTILAFFIFRNPISVNGVIGFFLVIGGSFIYTLLRGYDHLESERKNNHYISLKNIDHLESERKNTILNNQV